MNIICYDSDQIVDSGAFYYVTPHKHFFSTYIEGDFGYVRMENELSCKVVGMEDKYLDTDTRCQLILRNA